LPELEAVRREFEPLGVGFIALSLERDEAKVRRAVAELGVTMTVATVTGEVLAPLGVGEVPSTVFIDADGTLVAAASGPRSERFLAARARELLARRR
jgi:hypothetical protein